MDTPSATKLLRHLHTQYTINSTIMKAATAVDSRGGGCCKGDNNKGCNDNDNTKKPGKKKTSTTSLASTQEPFAYMLD